MSSVGPPPSNERRSLLAKFRYATLFQIMLMLALAVGAFLPTLGSLAERAAERREQAKTEVIDAGVNNMARLLSMEFGTGFLPELWQAADALERSIADGQDEEQRRALGAGLDQRAQHLDERVAEKISYNGVLVDLVLALPKHDPRRPRNVFTFPSTLEAIDAIDLDEMRRLGATKQLTKIADGSRSPATQGRDRNVLRDYLARSAEQLRGQAYLMPIRREGVPYGYAGLVVKTELISEQFESNWSDFWLGLQESLVWMAGLSLVALAGGGLFISVLASRLIRPLEGMRAALAGVRASPGQGIDPRDLRLAEQRLARVAADPLDEVGALRASFLELSTSLVETLEQKAEALERLKESMQQLQRADRLKLVGTLAYGLAHNLNNALSPVANLANATALRYPDDERLREMMEMVVAAVARSASLVGRLRDLTRLGSGEFVSVDLNRVLDEALESVRRDMALAGVAVHSELAPTPLLEGNPIELWEVFTNLLINAREALQHAAPGRARQVVVRSRVEEGQALVEIEDTGPGMPREVLERATEAWFSTKAAPQASGIGLWISQRIVEEHRGRLELRSEPGQGTRAVVRLPITTPRLALLPPG